MEHRDDPVLATTPMEIFWEEGDERIGQSYLYLIITDVPMEDSMTNGELVHALDGLNHVRLDYPGLDIDTEIFRNGIDSIALLRMDTWDPELAIN